MKNQIRVGLLLCILSALGACGASNVGDENFVTNDTTQSLNSLVTEGGEDPVYEQSLPSETELKTTVVCTGSCAHACIAACNNGTIGRPGAACSSGACAAAAINYCRTRRGVAVGCRGYVR